MIYKVVLEKVWSIKLTLSIPAVTQHREGKDGDRAKQKSQESYSC